MKHKVTSAGELYRCAGCGEVMLIAPEELNESLNVSEFLDCGPLEVIPPRVPLEHRALRAGALAPGVKP
jgi:hypothetical protein